MKQLVPYIILFFLFTVKPGFTQEKDSLQTSNSIIYEKVYLHIDRELYAPGDDIWFKSYLVSGINNKLIPGYKNIYVQLLSENGEIVSNRLLLSTEGIANGDFKLPADITDGTYIIRAFTKYLTNFPEKSCFHKKIVISASKNSFEISKSQDETEPQKIDISFLPEGGNFVLNAINYVAFKAIDEKGKGVSVKGKVVDQTGEEVVPFQTTYKGMGKFMMMPQEGKQYFALVDNHPEFNYQFDDAKPDGIAISYKPEGNYLLFTLSRNLTVNTPQNFIMKATHKGFELFYSQITMNEFQHAQRLYKGLFPLGISKITILDDNKNIVAERLVFVQNKDNKPVKLDINKDEFKTREKVNINVTSLLPVTDTIISNLSVAVVNEDYFSSSGNNQTIESYLLLDSELKGAIESPASFFIDENDITSDVKLDLVMMVNGWRSYYWNDLEKYFGKDLPFWADYGLTLKGNVVKMWGSKPVEEGKVVIGPFSGSFLFEETTTDANGSFSFDRLYLKDQAKIMINAQTKTGNRKTDIFLDPQFEMDTLFPNADLDNCSTEISIPLKFYRENYYRQVAESEYLVKSGILLDEIQVVEQKVIGDGHVRLYGQPDVSIKVLQDDFQNYFNILDYLQGRVPGVVVVGDQVRIRGAARNPLLIVDGLETSWDDIINTPLSDVDKIEILKTGFSTSIYGSRGGDGVIAVLTKMGKGEWENNWERIVHGRITPRVTGFQQPREFYSPKYSMDVVNDRPDKRPTLLWNPNVKVENGQANIEFYTADDLARYNIFIEGISKSGKICVATGLLTVSIPGR